MIKDIKFERETIFEPAFDKRDPDPNKNYGIHGVNLRMHLKGPHGVVQFVLYTNWQLPHVTEEFRTKMNSGNYYLYEPLPADLGYHSYIPLYEGQTSMGECKLLGNVDCYYGGSGLAATRIYNVLLEKGSEGVWEELEKYYKQIFLENE